MKQFLTLLLLCVATLASGQGYITVWHNDHSTEALPRATVDSMTFAPGQKQFSMWLAGLPTATRQLSAVDSITFALPANGIALTTGAPVSVTSTSMTAYCAATLTTTIDSAKAIGSERGVCWSADKAEPTVADSKLAQGTLAAGAWTATLDGLQNGKVYYYRTYAILDGHTSYGPVRTFTAGTSTAVAKNTPVDLGLSVCWSSSNLEAASASTGGVTLSSVGLSAGKVYAISTARGGWYADTQFKSTKDAGTSASSADSHQQFAFVPNPSDSSIIYLYSVSQKMFVRRDRSLSANSPERIYIFHDTGDSSYPYFFSFTADKSAANINIGGANQMTVDNWKTYDQGNKCQLSEVSGTEYDAAAAQAQITTTGSYYAWGETATKDSYLWSNYKYGNGLNRNKYTTGDSKKTLEAADDAATATLGNGWRMPTADEFKELREQCQWVWEPLAASYRVIGPNGNSILLPAAGFRYGTSLYVSGQYGYYLTSTVGESDDCAHSTGVFSDCPAWDYTTARFFGCTIRPVKVKSDK